MSDRAVMSAHGADYDADDQVSVVAVLRILAKRARLIVLLPTITVAFVGVVLFVRGIDSEATSAFMPQTSESQARLMGLAAQFGIGLPIGQNGESVEFYAKLLQSNEVLEQVVLTEYDMPSGGDRSEKVNLIDYLDINGDSLPDKILNAVERLRKDVSVSIDPAAGLVTLRTKAPTPELAVAINNRMLQVVNEFNLSKRRTQASAEREFVESRLAEAKKELNLAEDELESFYAVNRDYSGSPRLLLAAGRLQRAVELRQQLYVSLAQAFEQARLEEVRSTPMIVIVDWPDGFAKPAISVVFIGIVAIVLSGILALSLAFVLEYFEREMRHRPGELRSISREIRRALGIGIR